jgi:NADPH:quinone reductase-like Zn-dependent oxidoreductase
MRAIVQDTYGSAEVLRLTDIARPTPADDEVLLQVRAAGLDRGAWHLMRGRPFLARVAFGLTRPKNPVPGTEVAGTVVAVGSAVTRFTIGDEVFGVGRGAFAEYTVGREDKLARKPVNASFQQAAALAVSAATAVQALVDVGHVMAGQSVLVIGASGASAATQCRWRRREVRTSPACAALRSSTWSDPSVPTTSSTTPGRTSPTAPAPTT